MARRDRFEGVAEAALATLPGGGRTVREITAVAIEHDLLHELLPDYMANHTQEQLERRIGWEVRSAAAAWNPHKLYGPQIYEQRPRIGRVARGRYALAKETAPVR